MNSLVVLFVAVVALTYVDANLTGYCMNVCSYGYLQHTCVCRVPGQIITPTCDLMHCGPGTRCTSLGFRSMCVPILGNPAQCSLPVVQGLCMSYMTRYYYNPYTRSCLPFSYGGCGGNLNKYLTSFACRVTCGGI